MEENSPPGPIRHHGVNSVCFVNGLSMRQNHYSGTGRPPNTHKLSPQILPWHGGDPRDCAPNQHRHLIYCLSATSHGKDSRGTNPRKDVPCASPSSITGTGCPHASRAIRSGRDRKSPRLHCVLTCTQGWDLEVLGCHSRAL